MGPRLRKKPDVSVNRSRNGHFGKRVLDKTTGWYDLELTVDLQLYASCVATHGTRTPASYGSTLREKNYLEFVHIDVASSYTETIDRNLIRWRSWTAHHGKAISTACVAARTSSGSSPGSARKLGCPIPPHRQRPWENTSKVFIDYCDEHGIRRGLTSPRTPQQNAPVENFTVSILKYARASRRDIDGVAPHLDFAHLEKTCSGPTSRSSGWKSGCV